VHPSLWRTCVVVAGIVLGGLLACQASRPPNNPGALPTPRAEVIPRLNASTYVAHGHLLEQQGELEQAAAQYQKALQLAPDLVGARNRLGVTLDRLGRHHEASAEFRAALARRPGAAFLYNNLGFSLYLEERLEEAEQALARASELQPTFRRAHMNHGLVLAKLGRFDEALAAFCLAGPQADAYYNLAVLQTEAGRYTDAAHALQNALGLNPEFEEARQQLREVARLAAAEEVERAAQAAAAAAAQPPPSDVAPAADFESLSPCSDDATDAVLSNDGEPTDTWSAGGVLAGLPGMVARALGLPPLSSVAEFLDGLRAIAADRARWWEDALNRVTAALGLHDRPY
jgi:Flp pilus assembly protein TadD